MIKVTHYRKGNIPRNEWDHQEHGALMVEREQSSYDALGTMIFSELGFGGKIIELTETRIVTLTTVMAAIDTVIFEGTQEEMLPLLQTAYYYLKAGENHDEIMEQTLKQWESLPEEVKGKPLFVTTLGVWAFARNRLKAAALLGMGITDKEDLEAGMEVSIQDLATTVEIMQTFPEMADKSLHEVIAELNS
ncbi:hypothetical protein ACFL2U_01030 [Patescibacteria group bacterium]